MFSKTTEAVFNFSIWYRLIAYFMMMLMIKNLPADGVVHFGIPKFYTFRVLNIFVIVFAVLIKKAISVTCRGGHVPL
jgi:hypothetical protein